MESEIITDRELRLAGQLANAAHSLNTAAGLLYSGLYGVDDEVERAFEFLREADTIRDQMDVDAI